MAAMQTAYRSVRRRFVGVTALAAAATVLVPGAAWAHCGHHHSRAHVTRRHTTYRHVTYRRTTYRPAHVVTSRAHVTYYAYTAPRHVVTERPVINEYIYTSEPCVERRQTVRYYRDYDVAYRDRSDRDYRSCPPRTTYRAHRVYRDYAGYRDYGLYDDGPPYQPQYQRTWSSGYDDDDRRVREHRRCR